MLWLEWRSDARAPFNFFLRFVGQATPLVCFWHEAADQPGPL
jgi:hypothetical protein